MTAETALPAQSWAARRPPPPKPARRARLSVCRAVLTIVVLGLAAVDHALAFPETLTGRQFDGDDGGRWAGVLVVAGIAFIVWLHGARANARTYAGGRPAALARSTVWSWLVPFHQCWAPYALMRAVVLATTPARRLRVVLRGWWGLWLGMWAAWWGSLAAASAADRSGRGVDASVRWTDAAFRAFGVAAALAAIVLVVGVTTAQHARRTEPVDEPPPTALNRGDADVSLALSLAASVVLAVPAWMVGMTYSDFTIPRVDLSYDELPGTWRDAGGGMVILTADGRFVARDIPSLDWQADLPRKLPAPMHERWSGEGTWAYTHGRLTLTGRQQATSVRPAPQNLTTHGSHRDPRLNTEWGNPDSPFRYELRRTGGGPRPISPRPSLLYPQPTRRQAQAVDSVGRPASVQSSPRPPASAKAPSSAASATSPAWRPHSWTPGNGSCRRRSCTDRRLWAREHRRRNASPHSSTPTSTTCWSTST